MSKTIDVKGTGSILLEKSKRSKHINIFVMPFKGVCVKVPFSVSFKEAEDAVHSKASWIKKHQAKMKKFEVKYLSRPRINEGFDAEEAKNILTLKVKELSRKHNFTFKKISIRNQKTRWGSCSHKNNISLNAKLALLPERIINYVIIHELMHTKIKNHSKEFWSSLNSLVEGAKKIDAELKDYHLELM